MVCRFCTVIRLPLVGRRENHFSQESKLPAEPQLEFNPFGTSQFFGFTIGMQLYRQFLVNFVCPESGENISVRFDEHSLRTKRSCELFV